VLNVDPEGLKILSGDPLFNVIDQYEPQLSALDRAMTYYDLQQTYDYKGEGLFESYNPFLTRLAPVDANVRAYKTDSNGCYYAYKVMNLKEGQREPTLRYVPLNVGDSTVGEHFAFNSSFLEGLQWEGHVRSQAGRYQKNELDWGNFWGKFTNVNLNFAAVIDTGLGLNKAAAAKLAQAEGATAKVRLLNNIEEIRAARAARMRAATAVETDAPVMKILFDEHGFVRIGKNRFPVSIVNASSTISERELVNFSRWAANRELLDETDVLYRLHPKGRSSGPWWTRAKPESEIQYRIDAAWVPEFGAAEELSILRIPRGKGLYGWDGLASSQGGFYVGEKGQIYVPNIPKDWISTMPF